MEENPYLSPLSPPERATNHRAYSPMVKSVIRGSVCGAVLLVGLNLIFLRFVQWWHQQGYRTEGSSPPSVIGILDATFCTAVAGAIGGAFVGGVARWVRQKLDSN